jgi:hypothetical protein
MAANVAMLRHVISLHKGMFRRDGTVPTWDEDVEGACAECAVAKTLNLYWSGSVNCFSNPDVGPIGVRHTVRSLDENAHLIVRPRDAKRYGSQSRMVFVTGQRGKYQIHGWITIGEAQQSQWLRDPKGLGAAWFVPASALKPMSAGT